MGLNNEKSIVFLFSLTITKSLEVDKKPLPVPTKI